MVNYLHKILVKSPSIHTSSVTSVIAPIYAMSVLSVHPSDDKCQEIMDKFPSTNYGENFPVEIMAKIMAKIPEDITLTLHQVKFSEKTPANSNRINVMEKFLYGQKWVKFMEINLHN